MWFPLDSLFTDGNGAALWNVRYNLNLIFHKAAPLLTPHFKLPFNICLYRFSWHVTQSRVSQKHSNFRTFSSFSCISFELLSFLPSVSKTNVHKLSIPLHLKAIIKIFRSGFWDLWLAIQTCRRGVTPHASSGHGVWGYNSKAHAYNWSLPRNTKKTINLAQFDV